jgi:beta-lactamase regulating signal transducer with metallopeptidase domain
MTAPPDFTALAQLSAERILYCLVEGTLIVAFAALLLRARRQNASTRFAVWFCALLAIAASLFFGGTLWSNLGEIQPSAPASHSPIMLPGSWALYLFGAWAAIAAVGLTRIASGLWKLRALRKSCVKISPAKLDAAICRALTLSQRNSPVGLCVSDRVQSPVAVGLAKPAIILPPWLLEDLSAAELEQIILHEVEHLRRWDDWTNLAQKFLKALLFFHPAVWWIERQISLEREMACDDAVLAQTSSPRAYAECLTHLAEKSFLRRSLVLAQAAVSRVGQTALRVAQILDGTRPRGTTKVWKPAVSLVAAFTLACLVSLSRSPKLVAFQDETASRASRPANTVLAHAVIPAPLLVSPHADVPVNALRNDVSLRRSAGHKTVPHGPEMAQVNTKPQAEPQPEAFLLPASYEPERDSLPQAATARDSDAKRLTVKETVMIFVVGGTPDSPRYVTYRLSVWRVTVLPAASQNTTFPKTT